MKRVTYLSAWRNPQHFIIEDHNVAQYVEHGKDQQYKVVVTDVEDNEPTELTK